MIAAQGQPLPLPPLSSTYNLGDRVRGADCSSQPFEGVVTERAGPYSVILDGFMFTPTSLIDEVVERVAKTTANCSVCGEPQFETPSGDVCRNGHGGAPNNGGVFD